MKWATTIRRIRPQLWPFKNMCCEMGLESEKGLKMSGGRVFQRWFPDGLTFTPFSGCLVFPPRTFFILHRRSPDSLSLSLSLCPGVLLAAHCGSFSFSTFIRYLFCFQRSARPQRQPPGALAVPLTPSITVRRRRQRPGAR